MNIVNSTFDVLIVSDYLYFVMFPKFIYPFYWMTMTLSILLTLAIAHERSNAIRYPITQRQRMSSAKFRRYRLSQYVCSGIILSVLLNIPHAFEGEFGWRLVNNDTLSLNDKLMKKFEYLNKYTISDRKYVEMSRYLF